MVIIINVVLFIFVGINVCGLNENDCKFGVNDFVNIRWFKIWLFNEYWIFWINLVMIFF